MKKQFIILAFGEKQKTRNEFFFFFWPQNVFFGIGAESSILKKRGRPKSMVSHSFIQCTPNPLSSIRIALLSLSYIILTRKYHFNTKVAIKPILVRVFSSLKRNSSSKSFLFFQENSFVKTFFLFSYKRGSLDQIHQNSVLYCLYNLLIQEKSFLFLNGVKEYNSMVEYYHDMVDVIISILIISKLNVSLAIFLGNFFFYFFSLTENILLF